MGNPGQPTISFGDTGAPVRRLERALRRTLDLDLKVNGVFGDQVESAVKEAEHKFGFKTSTVYSARSKWRGRI